MSNMFRMNCGVFKAHAVFLKMFHVNLYFVLAVLFMYFHENIFHYFEKFQQILKLFTSFVRKSFEQLILFTVLYFYCCFYRE